MRNDPPEAFTRALAGLSEPALAAFVADLWAARGWETRVEVRADDVLVVRTRDDEQSTMLLPAPASPGARVRRALGGRRGRDSNTDIDAVVSPIPDSRAASFAAVPDVRLYDARALYDLARYGVDSAAADAICRRHLGQGIGVGTGRDSGVTPDRLGVRTSLARWLGGRTPSDVSTLLSVVVVVALLGVVVAGTVDVGFGEVAGDGDAAPVGADTVPTPIVGTNETQTGEFDETDPFGTGPPVGDVDDDPSPMLAPGFTFDGVSDPDALARAHARQVDGRSYVWRVTYTERRGDLVTSATATHRVRNASVHRVDVATTGVLATDPGRFVPRPAYADGTSRYVLSRGRLLQRPLESRDHYAGHAERVFARLFRATESDVAERGVRNGTVRYRLTLSGAPDPNWVGYRATALVTDEGVVHAVDATWVDRRSNVTVSVSVTYDFVDDPNVSRPSWAWTAEDAPSDNTTATPAATPTTAG